MTSFRLSIEWSRLEKNQGDTWDPASIAVYRDMLTYIKFKKMTPIVTIYHFTFPLWFFDMDHFLQSSNIPIFSQMCGRMASTFGDLTDLWATHNEPQGQAINMFFMGNFPNKGTGLAK
mmetsp:Transcript_56762/g.123586  ORF Transcript_56762/g.123586 Transcript_56762/m.123586 type:complete len:118 (+) Transcript_56762:308-661(+)|eukprot:CAMPEP_0116913548 /NCGR_PEP_ID=MMETSP0467-20121206/16769_1 /TAXON_ID=283647 /ORGANISM="Mesodinium pulex, Strain SPMC105" /LENGTH=117 /DNA_ID=CAMNT_0004589783 /DNA_START=308 /DNA_END=661 /DNA_ORIENTATION=+